MKPTFHENIHRKPIYLRMNESHSDFIRLTFSINPKSCIFKPLKHREFIIDFFQLVT